jgi:hypothetical protein
MHTEKVARSFEIKSVVFNFLWALNHAGAREGHIIRVVPKCLWVYIKRPGKGGGSGRVFR